MLVLTSGAAQVALEQRAPVGACIGTLYKGMDKQPQVREWARHMHVRTPHPTKRCMLLWTGSADSPPATQGLGVHDFHAYVSAGDIKFRAEDLLAWWRPEAFVPGQRIPGWEWVHTPTFPYELRCAMLTCLLLQLSTAQLSWLACGLTPADCPTSLHCTLLCCQDLCAVLCRWVRGQLTHYQHCMFLHRHAYQYILFLDTDEFPILRLQAGRLPALLEQAAQQWPAASSFSFHRYAYRGGCRPSTQAQISTNLTRRDWHEQFDAREVQPESRRDIVERGWGHIMLDKGLVMGDKLAARPLAVDDLYLHWMRTARAGFTAKVHTLPTLVVYIKHIRKHSDSCEGLVFEDPPAQVTIKSLQLEQQRQG